jgi:two-component system, OmpR family, sensor kinase
MTDNSPTKPEGSTNDSLRDLEIGFIVHELKDPFAVIETGLRFLLERKDAYGPLSPRQEKTLRRLLRSTLRGRSLVADLLEIGRAGAGHVTFASFRPARTIQQTLLEAIETIASDVLEGIDTRATDGEVLNLLARRGIFLEIAPALESIEIVQDETKLHQIVVNLIKNALRFRKNRLTIKCSSSEQDLVIEVSDDGSGIAPEHHELIFQPYVQIGVEAAMEKKGHGLGLAGARLLARHIGGDITLQSKISQGSVFRLTVPMCGAIRSET